MRSSISNGVMIECGERPDSTSSHALVSAAAAYSTRSREVLPLVAMMKFRSRQRPMFRGLRCARASGRTISGGDGGSFERRKRRRHDAVSVVAYFTVLVIGRERESALTARSEPGARSADDPARVASAPVETWQTALTIGGPLFGVWLGAALAGGVPNGTGSVRRERMPTSNCSICSPSSARPFTWASRSASFGPTLRENMATTSRASSKRGGASWTILSMSSFTSTCSVDDSARHTRPERTTSCSECFSASTPQARARPNGISQGRM